MRLEKSRLSIKSSLSLIPGLLVCFLAVSAPSLAETQWNVGVSGGSEGIEGFHVSVGEYYHVPAREVVVIHDRGIHEEELPVVFFLSRRAHVSPEAIVRLRLRGMNWMDITLHFGLSPEVYYVPVRYGPPYGHAYGHYKKHPKGGWGRHDLRDVDIVNQVNLRFISDHHGYAPEQVMKYRNQGRSFTVIDRDVRYERQGKAKHQPKDYRQNEYKHNDSRHYDKGNGKDSKHYENGKGKKWEND